MAKKEGREERMIDTHCHLDDTRYSEDLDAVIARAKERGIEKFIIPGADPKTLPRAAALAERYESVYFAVGVHPYDAANYRRDFLERFVTHEKCVAIGECGLDYYRLPEGDAAVAEEKERQKAVFTDQICWAKSLGKPLIVHIRDAGSDAMALLERYAGEAGGVLHCYNADSSLLALSSRNFYYGIGGVITFKNAKKLMNVYPKIPMERLLIETDAPYLTPHPYRGERNEPAYCREIAEKMSELSGISREALETLTTRNAATLFGI